MKGQTVEQVKSYKYLGTLILNWISRRTVKLYVRKDNSVYTAWGSFNVDKTLMTLFYRTFIESVISFSLASWYGQVPLTHRNRLDQIVKWSSKLIGETQLHPSSLYARQLQRIAMAILNDSLHPLNSEFQYLPSGRRLTVPGCSQKTKKQFCPNCNHAVKQYAKHSTSTLAIIVGYSYFCTINCTMHFRSMYCSYFLHILHKALLGLAPPYLPLCTKTIMIMYCK